MSLPPLKEKPEFYFQSEIEKKKWAWEKLIQDFNNLKQLAAQKMEMLTQDREQDKVDNLDSIFASFKGNFKREYKLQKEETIILRGILAEFFDMTLLAEKIISYYDSENCVLTDEKRERFGFTKDKVVGSINDKFDKRLKIPIFLLLTIKGLNIDFDKHLSKASIPGLFKQAGYVQEIEESIEETEYESDFIHYVERPPIEEECYRDIEDGGSILRIKAPQGFGKTELIHKILEKAEEKGYHKVYLNFHLDSKILNNIDTLLRWFCDKIHRGVASSLPLPNEWHSKELNDYDCQVYLLDCVLSQIDKPLVLGLDGIDRAFSGYNISDSTISETFLGMFRRWHEEAKSDKILRKLRVVMLYSTEALIPRHRSPFNVGIARKLSAFDGEQIAKLARTYNINLDERKVKELIEELGGHPNLIHLIIKEVSLQQKTIDHLLSGSIIPLGIYNNHLARLEEAIGSYPDLVEGLREVVQASNPVQLEGKLGSKLDCMGLVKEIDGKYFPFCNLYRKYFSNLLL